MIINQRQSTIINSTVKVSFTDYVRYMNMLTQIRYIRRALRAIIITELKRLL